MTLVTRYDYRSMTGDMSTLDVDVDANIATGLQTLQEWLDRTLEQQAFTQETVRIHPDGRAYVRNMPLVSVSDPPNVIIRDQAILGLFPQLSPQFDPVYEGYRMWGWEGPGWEDRTFPIAFVTYIGGWTASTLPRKLRQAIVDLARVEAQTFDPMAAGVTSATVGDVRVTYSEPPDRAGVITAILHEVRGFRRREIGY